jgi:hypothetical protein
MTFYTEFAAVTVLRIQQKLGLGIRININSLFYMAHKKDLEFRTSNHPNLKTTCFITDSVSVRGMSIRTTNKAQKRKTTVDKAIRLEGWRGPASCWSRWST